MIATSRIGRHLPVTARTVADLHRMAGVTTPPPAAAAVDRPQPVWLDDDPDDPSRNPYAGEDDDTPIRMPHRQDDEPANRGCKTCEHFEVDESEPDVGYIGKGEICRAGWTFPVDAQRRQTLAVHCPSWARQDEDVAS